jgi:hypothetical protein
MPIPMPSGGLLRQVSERSSKPGYPETLTQLSIDDLDPDAVAVVDSDVDLDLDLDSKILQKPIPPSMAICELALPKGESSYIDMAI